MRRTCKQVLAMLLAVLLLCGAAPLTGLAGIADHLSVTAAAETDSGTCGAEGGGSNVTWEMNTETETLTISGSGEMKDYYNEAPWSYSYAAFIKTVTIGNGVTNIGNCAFYDCTSLTSITIPDSVTSIGARAFDNCTSLASITIPNSVTSIDNLAFDDCTSLESITIPDSVTSIGSKAFYYCQSISVDAQNANYSSDAYGVLYNKDKTTLIQYPTSNPRESFTIPDSVIDIGNYAFCDCTNLTSITIPNSVTSIGYQAFIGCTSLAGITIPDSVTDIGTLAFNACTNLTSVTIPDSVTTISYGAFYGCTSLASVTIGDSVTSIGTFAFCNCTNLTSVTIPDSVTSIGTSAFFNCTNLTSVTIPDSVTSIGDSAFGGCTSLTAFSVDAQNANYSIDAYGVLYNKDKTTLIQYPIGNPRESFTIPGSVTSIDSSAFYNCTSLASVTIPNSVTSIGRDAFNGCSSLASVTIPNSVTSIGDYAFNRCRSLASVTIGNSVTSIGYDAFTGCDALADVFYRGTPDKWEKIDIKNDGTLINATIHFIADEPYLTLHCPSRVYDADFTAYGVANPDAEVSVYDGETLLGTVQVDGEGSWRGSFTLQNPADPSEHTIIAKVTFGEQTSEISKTLNFDKKTVYPNSFTLVHNAKEIDMLYVWQVNLTVVPSFPMDFEVKLNTNDGVQTVEIVSVKGAEVKSVSAVYDSATDTWKVSGWFDPANHSYVPGTLDLQINGERLFMETAKINYLIDPSGYVYEAVQSNRVAEATASIYVKEGADETLWNANRYEQDNPQTTDAFGVYHWDVTEGSWRVKVEKDGYQTAYSDWMDVPPEWTEVAIPLVTTQAPQITDVTYDGAVTVTFSQYMDIASVSAENVTVQRGGTAVPVTVTPVNAEESGTDSAVSYASVFRVQPQTALSGMADVRIGNVKNYAGIALEQAYTCAVGEDAPEYTAVFVVDGVQVSQAKYAEGAGILKPADPVKEGYTFTGWSPEVPATMPAKDMTFTAQFTSNTKPVATKLNIVKKPSKTTYTYRNDTSVNLSGLELEVVYSDGTKKTVTDTSGCKVSGYSAKPVGSKTVTVEYEGVKTSFNVTVQYAGWQWIILILLFGFLWY